MPESQLITDIESAFKKKGLVKTAKEFADLIGENPNGLSDIKAGRKKLNDRSHKDSEKITSRAKP
jgi:hypothetical protein